MTFGLNQETIDKIKSVFKRHAEVEKVIIYGSRTKGNFRNGSDIDLTLKGTGLSYNILSDISIEIDDLNTPYLFDISIFEKLNSSDLQEHITRAGKIFYSKEKP